MKWQWSLEVEAWILLATLGLISLLGDFNTQQGVVFTIGIGLSVILNIVNAVQNYRASKQVNHVVK